MLLSPNIPISLFPAKTIPCHFVPNVICLLVGVFFLWFCLFPSTVLFCNDYQLSSKTYLTWINLLFPFRTCSACQCALKAELVSGGHLFVGFLYKLLLVVTRKSFSLQGTVPWDFQCYSCWLFADAGIQFRDTFHQYPVDVRDTKQ